MPKKSGFINFSAIKESMYVQNLFYFKVSVLLNW